MLFNVAGVVLWIAFIDQLAALVTGISPRFPAALHQARRLVAEEPNRLPAYTVEVDVLTNLKRIYYFTKRLARGVLPETMSS